MARYQKILNISDPAFYAGRYATAVAEADRQLGRILKALDEQGRLDNAIVVLTADHGESFDERDGGGSASDLQHGHLVAPRDVAGAL